MKKKDEDESKKKMFFERYFNILLMITALNQQTWSVGANSVRRIYKLNFYKFFYKFL